MDTLGTYTYTYDPLKDNKNERTLQSFSTKAEELMWDCQFGSSHSNCPYPTYSKFYQYYGVFDYGNQWIMAAFEKTQTKFSNGNADFSAYSDLGRVGTFRPFMYVPFILSSALTLLLLDQRPLRERPSK